MLQELFSSFESFISGMGIFQLTWQMCTMWAVVVVLLYFGVVKQFEPLLLVPIAFGALIANIPDNGMVISKLNSQTVSVSSDGKTVQQTPIQEVGFLQAEVVEVEAHDNVQLPDNTTEKAKGDYDKLMAEEAVVKPGKNKGEYTMEGQKTKHVMIKGLHGGLFDTIGLGIKMEIFPPIIFMGVGALTDFGPLLAAPKALLLGAAAQCGVAFTFLAAIALGFSQEQASAIGIIGGADGPTAIYLTTKLAPQLLGPIAIAAYSYMALIPLIQPPIMKLFTTDKMRQVKMEQAREVSKTEKIVFPIVVCTFVILLLPSTAPLVGCLMLGNLFRECGVTDRLSDTSQNALMNIVTIFLATSVGATMVAQNFLNLNTIKIIVLGLCAFAISTMGGLVGGLVMYKTSGGRINPLIGSAGVSAVPMAARVAQDVGRRYNKTNFLLMHAMGPNVAGVIGSAIAAGFLLSVFG